MREPISYRLLLSVTVCYCVAQVRELLLAVGLLGLLALVNAVATWQFRFETYERYLRLKYKVKNRIIFPLAYRKHDADEEEGERGRMQLAHKPGAPARRPRRTSTATRARIGTRL